MKNEFVHYAIQFGDTENEFSQGAKEFGHVPFNINDTMTKLIYTDQIH